MGLPGLKSSCRQGCVPPGGAGETRFLAFSTYCLRGPSSAEPAVQAAPCSCTISSCSQPSASLYQRKDGRTEGRLGLPWTHLDNAGSSPDLKGSQLAS